MQSFHNLLAAVDLAPSEPAAEERFKAISAEAIQTALWAARKTGARLTFFSVLDVPPGGRLSEQDRRILDEAEQAGRRVLEGLVAGARRQGIEAESRLVRGKAWVEIVRQVVRERHDLVVAGAARYIPWRFLLGGTVMKVVHNCPCPVWVTKSEPEAKPLNVLIASDLSEASEEVVRIGAEIVSLVEGKGCLLHVVDDPLARIRGAGLVEESGRQYIDSVRARAQRALAEQLARLGEPAVANVEIRVEKGSRLPDTTILKFVDEQQFDLLVMGTISRSGQPGVLAGNTAERLLPYLRCSLLAVKPKWFACPVPLPAEDAAPATAAP